MEKSIFDIMDEGENTQPHENQEIKPFSDAEAGANDFFDIDDEKETTETQEKQEKPQSEPERVGDAVLNSEANMFIMVLSIFIEKTAAGIAQSEPKKYKVTQAEKDDFKPILIEYMEVTGFRPNIHLQFWMAAIAIFGMKFVEAVQERIAKNKVKKVAPKKSAPNPKTSVESDNVVSMYKERTRFDVDKDGFYVRDESGNYVEKVNRREKPTSEILEMVKQYKAAGKSEKEFNAAILNYLGKK